MSGWWTVLNEYQNWCCAVCDVSAVTSGTLVIDHDHGTGLVRGMLCRSCNSLEGHGNQSARMVAYRANPPMVQLGLVERYADPFTGRPAEAAPVYEPGSALFETARAAILAMDAPDDADDVGAAFLASLVAS